MPGLPAWFTVTPLWQHVVFMSSTSRQQELPLGNTTPRHAVDRPGGVSWRSQLRAERINRGNHPVTLQALATCGTCANLATRETRSGRTIYKCGLTWSPSEKASVDSDIALSHPACIDYTTR